MAGLLLCTTPAAAQTDDERAGARAAATQGAHAFAERRWADAIDLFSRAESLVHSPVHGLYMARAHRQLNQLVKARELYIKLVNEPLAPDAPAPFKDAHTEAEAELAQLEPKIPYVSVVVQGAGPKPVTVTMDQGVVPPALLGVPRPVDPGEHRFQAFAEGMESAVSGVTVAEGRTETIVLTLQATSNPPPPAVAAVNQPPPVESPPAMGESPPPQPPGPVPADSGPATSSSVNGMKIGGFVALGVGAVGLGLGTVFALQAKSKVDDADSLCSGDPAGDGRCPVSLQGEIEGLDDDARSANTLSLVSFIVGGVGVATGVTLLVLSGNQSGEAPGPSVSAWVGPQSAGLKGRF